VTARWRYLDASGESCGASREFNDQEEAEAWLSDEWVKLLAAGIREVELIDGGTASYRMDLRRE
jgi:hypothetical protein